MPNWCENELTVTGDREQIEKFIEKAKGENGALDFNSFIPYPEKFVEMDRISREWEKSHPGDWGNRPKDGFNSGGYEWCVTNWETKWNACEVNVIDIEDREDKTTLQIHFETAWSPPNLVVLAMSKAFPELTFSMDYYECGAAFQGNFSAKAGEIANDETKEYFGERGG